jgi:hypothetical protein
MIIGSSVTSHEEGGFNERASDSKPLIELLLRGVVEEHHVGACVRAGDGEALAIG